VAESPRTGSLSVTQALFFRAISWPTGVSDFLRRADPATRLAFDGLFANSPGLSAAERVDVYANAYFYRQLTALSELFPRLAYLTGGVDWHNLITDYVLSCPSREPDLRRLGDRLPAFVAARESSGHAPLLSCVARLELAQSRALDAPGQVLSSADLGRLPADRWPSLRFELSEPTRLVASDWDLEWLAERCDHRQRDAALALERVEPHLVLSGRRGHTVYFRALGPDESLALSSLAAGSDFSGVCAALSASSPGFEPATMVSYLKRWLGDGVIGALQPI
jgi:hypothetical protein